jgi:formylglycine-generating enzyme required for sulfatase activity
MVVIPPGSFMMGSPDSEVGHGKAEGPVHQVRIAYTFAVGKYPVTRGEWRQFVEASDHPKSPCFLGGDWEKPRFAQDDNHPVVCVTWKDAITYTAWLTAKTGHHYRLLSEAEYEYASRAGSTSRYFWGDSQDDLCRYANAGATKFCKSEYPNTSPVGHYLPNRFGLYDTTGNVWERVQDCWNDSYSGAPTDGSAWQSRNCARRVIRSGAYTLDSPLSSASRGQSDGDAVASTGFRVARDDR